LNYTFFSKFVELLQYYAPRMFVPDANNHTEAKYDKNGHLSPVPGS
jgi:hypothetical protein